MSDAVVAQVLEDIPFTLDEAVLLKRAHVKPGSANAAELLHLMVEGVPLARPKVVYLAAYLSGRGEDWIELEGVRFDSRVLRVNTEKAFRVFPYIATCGLELHTWGENQEDMLHRFWADVLKEMALTTALQAFQHHLEDLYQPGPTASMNPGSLADWPIQQQQALFDLFGSRAAALGVQLTDSMLMVPNKTVSGIRYPTTEAFESCQLCPREDCPGRRMPYQADLYEQRYKK